MVQLLAAEWWRDVQGANGFETRAAAIGYAAAAILFLVALLIGLWLAWKRLKTISLQAWFKRLFAPKPKRTVIAFYERMTRLLEQKGLTRYPYQTPLEFAQDTGIPEVMLITEEYNRVRFGEGDLRTGEDDIRRAFEGLRARFD